MSYVIKQKFSLKELYPAEERAVRILLLEPEYYLRALYEKNLQEAGFDVVLAENMAHCRLLVKTLAPNLAVFSPHSEKDFPAFLSHLSGILTQHRSLPILTVGHSIPTEVLSRMMSLGVVSHIDRSLSRPKDLVLVVKTIIS